MSRSRWASALSFLLVLCLPAAAAAEGKFTVFNAEFRLRNSDDNLRIDVGYDFDGENDIAGPELRLYGRFGGSDSDGTFIGRVDEFVAKWRLGGGILLPFAINEGDAGSDGSRGSYAWFVSLEAELGVASYEYQPLDAADESSSTEASTALTLVLGTQQNTPGPVRVWGGEVRVRYERAWEAQDEVAVVSGPIPDAMERAGGTRVVSPPEVRATLSTRLFTYVNFGEICSAANPCGSFALGPAIAFSLGGPTQTAGMFDNAGSWNPVTDSASVRGELWLFYHPLGEPVNLRVGLGPFVDGRFQCANSPQRCDVDGGILVQLRAGARTRY